MDPHLELLLGDDLGFILGVYQRDWRGVLTLPGITQLTRIPSLPSSLARARVIPSMPALAVS
ncbi:hypothetical protein [Salinicola acroporae]|uniref:hypothetical protein n=1 Tax=Salinicola acroporae TaxID=1541440 RepID=UPI0024554DB9|nr:hypothetical protein [Salinicola acroporae]